MNRARLVIAPVAIALMTAALGAQGLPTAPPESVGMSAERLARLTHVMDEAAKAKEIAGSVTLVARGGRTVYLEASGLRDVEARAPMTEGHDLPHRVAVEGDHQRRRR